MPITLEGPYIKKAAPTGTLRRWVIAVALCAVAAGAVGYWFAHRAIEVTTVQPFMTAVTETIASSGLLGGVKEAAIDAAVNDSGTQRPVVVG